MKLADAHQYMPLFVVLRIYNLVPDKSSKNMCPAQENKQQKIKVVFYKRSLACLHKTSECLVQKTISTPPTEVFFISTPSSLCEFQFWFKDTVMYL